ncbi:MAG: choice-of-anchor Q domain-containing protein, partial [Candidatus Binatia bacterium]
MMRQPFLGILLAIVVCTAAQPIHAATIAVTTTVDELTTNGNCSLREAVRAANTNVAVDACPAGQNDQTDTITVPAGTYTLALAGVDNDASAGDLDLLNNAAVDDLVISGAGAATTIVQACTVDQQAADCPAGQGVVERVFHVIDGSVAISGVTVRHGRAPVFGSRHSGHGIYIQKINGIAPPVLALTDAVVTKNGRSNEAQESNGGGIANEDGTLTLTRMIVTDNIAGGGDGGGIYNRKLLGGEPILTMTDSTVSGNEAAGHGGGIANKDFGTATLTGCTISDNETAFGGGGGFYNGFNSATATLTNCTVSGNRSNGSFGGGIYNTGGTMSLRSTTVTLNRLGQGQGAGGINTISSPVVLRNSIVAGNIHELNPASVQYSPDCDAGGHLAVSSEGHNLVGDGFQCLGLVDGTNGDRIGTTGFVIDAKLGPLADNGGPTLTHGWLSGSPAIDAADPAPPGSGGTACPTTDQRGETRPSGAACDVGSFEGSGGGAIAAFSVQPASGGTAGTVQLRVFGDGFVTGAVVRLVRAGFADVVGVDTSIRGTVVTISLDLHDVAPGAWSVEVKNPDASVATLTDAFTVVAGGEPDVWVELVTPRGFQGDRVQSIHVLVGNRGSVDAYGVPLWVAFGEALRFFIPFVVSPPPAQPGQIATDWSSIAIDRGRPPSPAIPEQADSFHFLLPIVPAGSSSAFKIRVKSPPFAPGAPESINVATNWGDPYFQPDLRAEVVAFYVSQAKDYAVRAHGTTTFPADAAIEAYVRTQLAAVIAEGRVAAVGNETGDLPIYSQAQLIIDTGQFLAGESATASATSADRGWLARIVAELVGGSAEARFVGPLPDPCAGLNFAPDRFSCEQEIDPCRHGCGDDDAPSIPPTVPCEGAIKVVLDLLGAPCKPTEPVPPKPQPRPTPIAVPFQSSHDPNDKAGPGGPGGFIDGVTSLSYTVTYENIATASGDA